MSVSSNSRKESTESNAAQQMHSTMGVHPELGQLNDKSLENELPSRVAGSNDTDVPGDTAQAAAGTDDDSTDEDSPTTAYQQPSSSMDNETVPDADWNRSTTEGAMPATRANEPDRTLGNS